METEEKRDSQEKKDSTEKEYKNIVVFSPRYKKMLIIMTAVVLGMGILIVGISYFMLNRNKAEMAPDRYLLEKSRVERIAKMQLSMGILAMIAMFGIARIKQATKIVTNTKGIEYRTIFSKVFIPWDDIKDVKVKFTGTAMEQCLLRSKDLEKRMTFNAFMLDPNDNYKLASDGIFDEHGEQVTYNLKKCPLFREVNKYYGRKQKETGKK